MANDKNASPEMAAALLEEEVLEAGSTEAILVPEGTHMATIGELKFDKCILKGIGSNGEWFAVNIPLDVAWYEDGELMEATIYHMLFVDLVVDENTGSCKWDFRKGKNRKISQLRAAVAQNTAGMPWRLADLSGQQLNVTIVHKDYNNPKTGETTQQANVTMFIAM